MITTMRIRMATSTAEPVSAPLLQYGGSGQQVHCQDGNENGRVLPGHRSPLLIG
jgi:hypothetical protein